MKVSKERVPARLITKEQRAYQKALRETKRRIAAMQAIAKNPTLSGLGTKYVLRQALFHYNELLKNPPRRRIEDLGQQPTFGEEQ